MYRRWLTMLATAGAFALTGVSAAHAGYTTYVCDSGGTGINNFVNGAGVANGDEWGSYTSLCGDQGGTETFSLKNDPMAIGESPGAMLTLPAGEVFTHLNLTYSSEAASTTPAYLAIVMNVDNGTAQVQPVNAPTPASGTIDTDATDGTALTVALFCLPGSSSTCEYSDDPTKVVSISSIQMTLQDTGSPTVAATGALPSGPVGGTQSLTYQVTDNGSGVKTVGVQLGSTTVATNASTCFYDGVQPCPSTASGTFAIDTTKVPDGTYPVTVTATDVSGDVTTHTAGKITVSQTAAGTTTTPTTTTTTPTTTTPTTTPGPKPKTGTGKSPVGPNSTAKPGHHKHGFVNLVFHLTWKWFKQGGTAVKQLQLKKLPPHTTLTVSCSGRACPLKRISADSARTLGTLEKVLVGPKFRNGSKVTFAVSRPGYRSWRNVFTIVPYAVPQKQTFP